MKFLIATPLYPPDVGGPATYAKGLEDAFPMLGHQVTVLSYGSVMHLPSGIRQLSYALKLWSAMKGFDLVIALDTLSIGLPAAVLGRLRGIPVVVRVAGDRVWESFVARTKEPIPFPDFYKAPRPFSFSERMAYLLTKLTFSVAERVVFSTRWQMQVRLPAYPSAKGKSLLVENAYALLPTNAFVPQEEKVFLWAGRDIPLKNLDRLKEAFTLAKAHHPGIELRCFSGVPHEEVERAILGAYALILPSYSEDSPNFLLEGLAKGVPFITTIHNGLRDRIGELGIFVDPNDTKAIVEAIVMMSDEKVHDGYATRVKEFHFVRTYADIAEDYLAILKTL